MFSQNDDRWRDVALGVGGYQTIGSAGCLLCVSASMLKHFGVDTDPGRLNRWLCRNNGYVGGNRIVFSALVRCADASGVHISVSVIDCMRIPAPMDLVEDTLSADGVVLAKVDFAPGGSIQQHWVQITDVEDDDCLVFDPWLPFGGPYYLMARYAHYTWDDPERTLFRLALFEHSNGDDRVQTDTGEARKAQEQIFVHGIARAWSSSHTFVPSFNVGVD